MVGERQAQATGDRLGDEQYSHVYASDLSRAYRTAELIMEENKVSRLEGNKITIMKDKRLRERVSKNGRNLVILTFGIHTFSLLLKSGENFLFTGAF